MLPKYPKTPYWPHSQDFGEGKPPLVHGDPLRFVGRDVVVTEKLDGGNTLVHRGRVYARNVDAPSRHKWMAMVRKHVAWKVQDDDVLLYGEDIYAVHSIEYGPVPENQTFYAFGLRFGDRFASFAELEEYVSTRGIPLVPVLFRGRFGSLAALRDFLGAAHQKPSVLEGECEGVVLRLASGFAARDFAANVCKSVRYNHLATTRDWSRTWRPCALLPAAADRATPSSLVELRLPRSRVSR